MAIDKKVKQVLSGKVISTDMDKTIVVKTVSMYRDPLFHKILKKNKNYKVHDEQELAQVNDIVEIYEGRPISKSKRMYLARVVTRQQD